MSADDGYTAFEPTTQTHIPFKSSTDALLANMLFREEIGVQKFNHLLDVLNNPKFDVNRVTFKEPIDIFLHIATQRRTAAMNRSNGAESVGIPLVAFPRVIQCFVEEIPQIEGPVYYREVSDAERALSNMSLVHRSWSFAAQKGLGTRVTIRGTAALRSAMLSPIIGPWTREFAYTWMMTAHWKHGAIPEDTMETYTLLSAILNRLTGLRRLSLRSEHGDCDHSLVQSFIDALRTSPSLEFLWLYHEIFECDDNSNIQFLPLLCEALPSMSGLTMLSFSGWTCTEDSTNIHEAPSVPNACPGRNLKTLVLPQIRSLTYLSWLTRPRGHFAPWKLKFDVINSERREDIDNMLTTLRPCLSAVEALSLSISIDPDDIENRELRSFSIANEMISATRSLRNLTITAYARRLESESGPRLFIPATIERLCFTFNHYEPSNLDAVKRYWTNVGKMLLDTIVANTPNLEMVIMMHVDMNGRTPSPPDHGIIDDTRGIPSPLIHVAEECDRRGISFLFLYDRKTLRSLGMD